MSKINRAACVAAVLVFATACSDSSAAVPTDDVKITDAIVATTTVPDLYDVVHAPASGEFVGALDDITAHTCEHVADGWRVTGTATNPTGNIVDYRVYISLLNGTAMTRALAEVELLAISSGRAGTFEKSIAMPDSDLRCVLRVERRPNGQ